MPSTNPEKKEPPRVVLDTNVMVSGLLWKGKSNQILEWVEEGKLELCQSKKTLEELTQVLDYPRIKKRVKKLGMKADEIIVSVERGSKIFDILTNEAVVTEDPDDDIFINLALTSGAKFIVSGDSHLLNIGQHKDIKILSPNQFVNMFKMKRRQGQYL